MSKPLTDTQLVLARLDHLGAQIDQLQDLKLPRYLSAKSVGVMLDLKENAVRQLIHRGVIPSYRFGNRRLVLLEDVQKLLVRYPSKDELLAQYEDLI